jgi:Trk-type K+ transport system membrane component
MANPSTAVRAAGFVVISIPSLYIGVQVLYLIMMYIAVYPVVITMRNSNVYEERSLGIYDDDPSAGEPQAIPAPAEEETVAQGKGALRRRNTAAVIGKRLRRATTFQGVGVAPKSGEDASTLSFVSQQIKGQLAHDLWWLVLAIMAIVIIETDHFREDPITYSVFNILFEAVSAYACVGLSVGLPTQSYALSGGLHAASKVILAIVMMRGRHRGLPVAIDRAVRLPGENLHRDEEEDSRIRKSRTISRMASQEV